MKMIISNKVCEDDKRSIRHFTEGMICVGGEEGHGVCHGDSGGPLQCKIESQYVQDGCDFMG
jgi:secreted trypsin-like serine protease